MRIAILVIDLLPSVVRKRMQWKLIRLFLGSVGVPM